MKKNILLLLSVFVFVQCSASPSSKIEDNDCDSIAWKIACLENDYFMIDEEQTYVRLDSVLTIIDSIEGKCPKYNANFYMKRIALLSFKHEYSKGLEYAEKMNDSLFSSTYKFVVVNRFRAMIAQEKGDFSTKNKYINEIINTLKSQLPDNEIDSVLKTQNVDSIIHYEKWVYLQAYFYYLAQKKGVDEINKYLNSKYNDIEDRYLWVIRPENDDDFMIFIGM